MAANNAIATAIENLCTAVKRQIELITDAGGAVTVEYFDMDTARDQHILETTVSLLVDLGEIDVETGVHYRLHAEEDE